MGTWMRRIRGAIGMGFTWAVAGAVAGGIPRWILGMNSDLPFPILFGGLGFIAGVTFSVILALTEGRHRFDEMSLPRFAAIGAVEGLVFSVLFVQGASLGLGSVLAIASTFSLACAACASGSLALARRAVDQPRIRTKTSDT